MNEKRISEIAGGEPFGGYFEHKRRGDEAAELIAQWTPRQFRDFAFYMCGFQPDAVVSFVRGRAS